MVEQRLQLRDGRYTLSSLANKVNGRQYVSDSSPGDEFRIEVDGKTLTGMGGGWSSRGGETSVLSQGEIQLTVHLQNGSMRVDRFYIIYPGTSVIRQWTVFQNVSSRALAISNPYFLAARLRPERTSALTLYYMTGGGSFTGSQMLKEVPLSADYVRSFDTADKDEVIPLEGVKFGGGLPWGSGAYMPWFCIADAKAGDGMFAGLDYYGRWAAEIGNHHGASGYLGFRVGGYNKDLEPGEAIQTPMAFMGVFQGDLDSMGNQLKNWQYRYLWDYTNADYFAKIRYTAEMRWQAGKGTVSWGGGTVDNWDYRLAAHLHAIDVMRYVGADILWQDAGWHDHLGDNDGPDFGESNEYLAKYGMRLAVWWPLYLVERASRVVQQHPEWRTTTDDTVSGTQLNTSRKDVIDYLAAQLAGKVKEWGDFQWRLDGTAVAAVDKNETPLLAQYHNVMGLEQGFRRRFPRSSIDVCAGGGNLMGFETLRVGDVSQLTDGGSLKVSNYYSSYLFPPDKIDDWTRNANFTWENARQILTMAAAWMSDRGLYGHEPGLLLNNGLENLRKTFEIYHYLVQKGVAGRWSQIYHPRIQGDEPLHYLERLSQDGSRGVIILTQFINGEVRIFPKGLIPKQTYDLRFEVSKAFGSRTGADLMGNGIALVNSAPGELIYLGLPNHPGSGADRTAPSDPGSVTKRTENNMGVSGIELQWSPSTDDNWLSHYLIYRNGELIDKVARGNYYFDHSGGLENLGAVYEVQAVDGDGNVSRKVTAGAVANAAEIYTARGGYLAGQDYSYQGAHGWSYEEWTGAHHALMIWNGALGQMGLYEGVSTDARKAVIGASWMRPGETADAVRVFTVPRSGQVTITGTVRKDIYHRYGDGVRVKILKEKNQIWPASGWQVIAGDDVGGRNVELKLQVQKDEKLFFIVNCNVDPFDDDAVWNPKIAYDDASLPSVSPFRRTLVDNDDTNLSFTGQGWQRLGVTPWGGDLDRGYLPGRFKGTLAVSGTAGDKLSFRFRGTGLELIGDTASDRGIATITLDGRQTAIMDTFVPENIMVWQWGHPSRIRQPGHYPALPATPIWAVQGLNDAEHTVEVTVTGRKNRESTGTFIAIDAVAILNGAVVPFTTK